MPPAKKTTLISDLEIPVLKHGAFEAWILGMTPFYCNRMAEKAKRELLLPRGSLTRAQKATRLKHAPLAEYRSSPYLRRGPGPTRIMMVASAPKKAMAQAAIDMPVGIAKTQINRMVFVPEEYIPIFGVPRLAMDVVRQAGIAKTPDIRTRARIDKWCAKLDIRYAEPMINLPAISALLQASGMLCGIGDWRQEKGGGSNGLYEVVDADDPRIKAIIEEGSMEAQDAALKDPDCANAESEELLQWYLAELERRGISAEDEQVEDVEVDIPDDMILPESMPISDIEGMPPPNGEDPQGPLAR